MDFAKAVAAALFTGAILFLLGSAAHEMSGHPIKKNASWCVDVVNIRICVGEVDYSLERKSAR